MWKSVFCFLECGVHGLNEGILTRVYANSCPFDGLINFFSQKTVGSATRVHSLLRRSKKASELFPSDADSKQGKSFPADKLCALSSSLFS